ncbi:MAG: succinate dehydrogenase [Burkholderiaceae bacterium]
MSKRLNRADLAHCGHRWSGIALAVFLPVHLYSLGLALHSADALDKLLVFGDLWIVRALQAALVGLLCIHLMFGMRVLIIEWAASRNTGQPANMRLGWIAPAIVIAVTLAFIYGLSG